jgi:hypothetical protein
MLKRLSITLALVAAVACGCGKKSTYQTKDGEVTVDKKNGQVTFEGKTKDGNVKVSANEAGVPLPDNFPKDVPIYKGAVVKVASTQGKMMLVHLTVSAPMAEVFKFYQDQLKEQGWEIETTMSLGEGNMLAAKKADRKCSAMVMKQDNGSMVQLTVTEEKP